MHMEACLSWTCLGWSNLYSLCSLQFYQNEHYKESAFFLIFGKDVYTSLVQLLNVKLKYMCNDINLLALDESLRYKHWWFIILHCPRWRQGDNFLTYHVPEFLAGDEVLVRNHTRDVWNANYVAHCVVLVMERHLEIMARVRGLMSKMSKSHTQLMNWSTVYLMKKLLGVKQSIMPVQSSWRTYSGH